MTTIVPPPPSSSSSLQLPRKVIKSIVTKINENDNITVDTYKRFLLLSSQSNDEIKKRFQLF